MKSKKLLRKLCAENYPDWREVAAERDPDDYDVNAWFRYAREYTVLKLYERWPVWDCWNDHWLL